MKHRKRTLSRRRVNGGSRRGLSRRKTKRSVGRRGKKLSRRKTKRSTGRRGKKLSRRKVGGMLGALRSRERHDDDDDDDAKNKRLADYKNKRLSREAEAEAEADARLLLAPIKAQKRVVTGLMDAGYTAIEAERAWENMSDDVKEDKILDITTDEQFWEKRAIIEKRRATVEARRVKAKAEGIPLVPYKNRRSGDPMGWTVTPVTYEDESYDDFIIRRDAAAIGATASTPSSNWRPSANVLRVDDGAGARHLIPFSQRPGTVKAEGSRTTEEDEQAACRSEGHWPQCMVLDLHGKLIPHLIIPAQKKAFTMQRVAREEFEKAQDLGQGTPENMKELERLRELLRRYRGVWLILSRLSEAHTNFLYAKENVHVVIAQGHFAHLMWDKAKEMATSFTRISIPSEVYVPEEDVNHPFEVDDLVVLKAGLDELKMGFASDNIIYKGNLAIVTRIDTDGVYMRREYLNEADYHPKEASIELGPAKNSDLRLATDGTAAADNFIPVDEQHLVNIGKKLPLPGYDFRTDDGAHGNGYYRTYNPPVESNELVEYEKRFYEVLDAIKKNLNLRTKVEKKIQRQLDELQRQVIMLCDRNCRSSIWDEKLDNPILSGRDNEGKQARDKLNKEADDALLYPVLSDEVVDNERERYEAWCQPWPTCSKGSTLPLVKETKSFFEKFGTEGAGRAAVEQEEERKRRVAAILSGD